MFLPAVVKPPAFRGPGVAGGAGDDVTSALYVTWDYSWGGCNGVGRCLPMWRYGCSWYGDWTVDALLHSCGAEPCGGLMILNEPGWQDQCDAGCQAWQLHDRVLEAWAIKPGLQIVFGNYVRAETPALDSLAAAWKQRYPGANLGRFLRSHNVRIGVHHYAWADYDRDVWRAQLQAFRADVWTRWGVEIVLSEYGALDSGPRWKQVVTDQALWLVGQNILAAPFVAAYAVPEDERWGCCPMWGNGALTEYGQLYAGLIDGWDRH